MSPSLVERSQLFLMFLDEWKAALPQISLKQAIQDPQRTAIISVDVINGFCTIGPLSSPRVGKCHCQAYCPPVQRSLGSRRAPHFAQPGYP